MFKKTKTIGVYFLAAVLSVLLLVIIMRLWNSNPMISYGYEGDGLFNLEIIKGIIDNGWYLTNPKLGAPFGLDFHGYPLADFLNMAIIKGIGMVTRSWALTLNLFFICTFPLVTLTALFVLLKLRVNTVVAVVAALIYTYIPYHLLRGEGHLLLAAFYMVPILCWMALNMFEEKGYLFLSETISWKNINKKHLLITAIHMCPN
jgi:phosphoglycerol transferase